VSAQPQVAPGPAPGPPVPPSEPRLGPLRLRHLRWVATAVWTTAFVVSLFVNGLPIDREVLIFWIMTGLLAASIGRRPLLSVLVDWLPFVAVLIAYDYSRGAAEALGMPTWWTPQISVDRFLSGGFLGHPVEPTVWLQAHLRHQDPPWWEVIVSCTYISFFIVPYAVAGVLWLRERRLWRQFASRFVAITLLGLVGFILIPASPPWAAAKCTGAQVSSHPASPPCLGGGPRLDGGLLGPVHSRHLAGDYIQRVAVRGFDRLGLHGARSFFAEGQGSVNLVAAVPSLHAGITLLTCIFLWRILRPWWRPVLVLYPALMVFSLVYSAEHYLADCLAGFVGAILVDVVATRVERRWTRRRTRWRPSRRADAPRTALSR
jgi:hypothetical protein